MKYTSLFLLVVGLASCGSEAPNADASQVNSPADIRNSQPISNSSLVNNPISADTPTDLSQLAKMEFEEIVYDFGKLKEGDKVEHTFKFKNTGKSPLVISEAKGSCGCTVPEYPRSPIAPGETGEIKVKFDSSGKSGKQEKTVTLVANTNPNQTILRITGDVASTNPAATH